MLDCMGYAGRDGQAVDGPVGDVDITNVPVLPDSNQGRAHDNEDFGPSFVVMVSTDRMG